MGSIHRSSRCRIRTGLGRGHATALRAVGALLLLVGAVSSGCTHQMQLRIRDMPAVPMPFFAKETVVVFTDTDCPDRITDTCQGHSFTVDNVQLAVREVLTKTWSRFCKDRRLAFDATAGEADIVVRPSIRCVLSWGIPNHATSTVALSVNRKDGSEVARHEATIELPFVMMSDGCGAMSSGLESALLLCICEVARKAWPGASVDERVALFMELHGEDIVARVMALEPAARDAELDKAVHESLEAGSAKE